MNKKFLFFLFLVPFLKVQDINASEYIRNVDPDKHNSCLKSKNYRLCTLSLKRITKEDKPWIKPIDWKTYDFGCINNSGTTNHCYITQHGEITAEDNLIKFESRVLSSPLSNYSFKKVGTKNSINCNYSPYKYLYQITFDDGSDFSQEYMKMTPTYKYFCLGNDAHLKDFQNKIDEYFGESIKDIYKFTNYEIANNKTNYVYSINHLGLENTINEFSKQISKRPSTYEYLLLKFNDQRTNDFIIQENLNPREGNNLLDSKFYNYKISLLKGMEKVSKSFENKNTCNQKQCYPGEIGEIETDNLDEKLIKGWAFSDDPINKRSFFYDMKVYKVKSNNEFGRYINTRSLYRFLWKGRPGTPGTLSSTGSTETTCYGSGSTFNCYSNPSIVTYIPGTPATSDKVNKVKRNVVYDCKDKTLAKYQNNNIKRIKDNRGKKKKWISWNSLKGSPEENNSDFWAINETNIEKWCEKIDSLPESDFTKFSKK